MTDLKRLIELNKRIEHIREMMKIIKVFISIPEENLTGQLTDKEKNNIIESHNTLHEDLQEYINEAKGIIDSFNEE